MTVMLLEIVALIVIELGQLTTFLQFLQVCYSVKSAEIAGLVSVRQDNKGPNCGKLWTRKTLPEINNQITGIQLFSSPKFDPNAT